MKKLLAVLLLALPLAAQESDFIVLATQTVGESTRPADSTRTHCTTNYDGSQANCVTRTGPGLGGLMVGALSSKKHHYSTLVGSNHVRYVVCCRALATGQTFKGSVAGEKLSLAAEHGEQIKLKIVSSEAVLDK